MMSVDPPGRDVDSDDDSSRRAEDAAEGAESMSSVPSVPPTETLHDAPSRLPKRIGHYDIKRVIASGGMGTVNEATQEKPPAGSGRQTDEAGYRLTLSHAAV